MIRPLTIVTFLMACGSGLYLYQSKHEAQVLDRTIEKTVRDTIVYREQSRLLAADWTMLNDPEMLRRYADTYLALKTISPSQFTSLADLDSRLPPVRLLAPADDTNEDAPAPLAAIPDAAPTTSVSNETVLGGIVEDPVQVPPRPVALPPIVAAASTATRPVERKIAVGSGLAAAEPAYRPAGGDVPVRSTSAAVAYRSAGTDAVGRPSAPITVPSPRVVATDETRPSDQRPGDPRSLDRRVPQLAETHGAEARVAEARAPMPLQRPTTDPIANRHPGTMPAAAGPVATTRLNTSRPPVSVPNPTQSASVGSLLGMARGSLPSPVPRPMPVSTTQW